uniref:Cytochrome b5 heme-binding domain-containing protein n=1 Tax=Steinernema glaseri TaxID=37863 RepID=A0A1I7YFM5_9BILA
MDFDREHPEGKYVVQGAVEVTHESFGPRPSNRRSAVKLGRRAIKSVQMTPEPSPNMTLLDRRVVVLVATQ